MARIYICDRCKKRIPYVATTLYKARTEWTTVLGKLFEQKMQLCTECNGKLRDFMGTRGDYNE